MFKKMAPLKNNKTDAPLGRFHTIGGQCMSISEKCIDDLREKRRNSIATALEIHLFCIKPSIGVNPEDDIFDNTICIIYLYGMWLYL